MYKTTRRPRAGFTLIELLTVIAIIGILAAILFPAIGAAKKAAQKANDLSNIRSLGQAALIYSSDNNDRLPDPQSTTNAFAASGTKFLQWFGILAKGGNLSDPSVCYSKLDANYPPDAVPSILDPQDATKTTLLAAFIASIPSYEVVGGLKASDPSSTPIAYTRGLKIDGTWDPVKGTYGTDGSGMIVFVGGNVAQYKVIGTPSSLIKTNGKVTTDITQTVPNNSTQRIYGYTNQASIGTDTGTTPTTAN